MFRRVFSPRAFVRHKSVYDKYKAQLTQKAEQQGLSLSELLDKSKDKIEELKKSETYDPLDLIAKSSKPKSTSTKSTNTKSTGAPQNPLASVIENTTGSGPSTQNLDSFVDVEKLAKHPKNEIEMIWKARFANSSHEFCGALETAPFSRLYVNAHRYPTMVFPLPHDEQGIELHYAQWNFAAPQTLHCLITSLAEYKLHQDYAAPHTTILLHSDFVADKGVALSNAIVQENRISLDMAVLLSLTMQRFYTADPASGPFAAGKLDLLRKFNTGDTSFSVDKLIEATETLD